MYKKAIAVTAALALATGLLFVASETCARGARGFAAHGPVFGFHPRAGGHRPFPSALAHRASPRFGWQLRWWNRFGRHRAGVDATYPAFDGVVPNTGDVTGVVPGPVFVPPAVPPAPTERIGCFARGYEVPAEMGGIAHVTVIRC